MTRFYQKIIILAISLLLGWAGWQGLNAFLYQESGQALTSPEGTANVKKINKTRAEWKKELTPAQYRIMFEKGTEPAFSGKYNNFWEKGIYFCAASGTPLFRSEDKYDHGTGWPSFKEPFSEAFLEYHDDLSFGTHRTEVRCAVCGGHLGHLFFDGPEPSGKHFCINSAALNFKPEEETVGKLPEVATLAAGCFWGVEYQLSRLDGVLATIVGYSGGKKINPTYYQVCTGKTGHAEAVQVVFDPKVLTYEALLRKYFEIHDPTQLNRQGADVGTNYRSAIFYHSETQRQTAEKIIAELQASNRYSGKKIVTELVPFKTFYRAEDYHQQFYEKNPERCCRVK